MSVNIEVISLVVSLLTAVGSILAIVKCRSECRTVEEDNVV